MTSFVLAAKRKRAVTHVGHSVDHLLAALDYLNAADSQIDTHGVHVLSVELGCAVDASRELVRKVAMELLAALEAERERPA